MKKAFTLAEILIVLSVIGIITAILLPAAHHITPDENALKFKKANATLGRVIRELVSSDEYYLDGDLGKKPDGSNVEDTSYLCRTFSELLSTKEVVCANETVASAPGNFVAADWFLNGTLPHTPEEELDKLCANKTTLKSYIITNDGVTYFEVLPEFPFGKQIEHVGTADVFYWVWDRLGLDQSDDGNYKSGFYYIYKPFCVDIDGINTGEAPFGYGIRVDGKIMYGARASEWMEKSIQNKD